MADSSIGVGKALLVIGGPISNLTLATGGIALLAILLNLENEIIGAAVFGLYFLGLTLIYSIMGPAIRLMGLARIFKAIIIIEGAVFAMFLAMFLAAALT